MKRELRRVLESGPSVPCRQRSDSETDSGTARLLYLSPRPQVFGPRTRADQPVALLRHCPARDLGQFHLQPPFSDPQDRRARLRVISETPGARVNRKRKGHLATVVEQMVHQRFGLPAKTPSLSSRSSSPCSCATHRAPTTSCVTEGQGRRRRHGPSSGKNP